MEDGQRKKLHKRFDILSDFSTTVQSYGPKTHFDDREPESWVFFSEQNEILFNSSYRPGIFQLLKQVTVLNSCEAKSQPQRKVLEKK